jgi:hypothetical protein
VDGVLEAYVQLTLHMHTQSRTLVQKNYNGKLYNRKHLNFQEDDSFTYGPENSTNLNAQMYSSKSSTVLVSFPLIIALLLYTGHRNKRRQFEVQLKECGKVLHMYMSLTNKYYCIRFQSTHNYAKYTQ